MELQPLVKESVESVSDLKVFGNRVYVKVKYTDGSVKWEKGSDVLSSNSMNQLNSNKPPKQSQIKVLSELNFSFKAKEYKLNKLEEIEAAIGELRQKYSVTFAKRFKLIKRTKRILLDLYKGYSSLNTEGAQFLYKRFENLYFNLYNWIESVEIEDYSSVDPLTLSKQLLFPQNDREDEMEKLKKSSFSNILEIVRSKFTEILGKIKENKLIYPSFIPTKHKIELSDENIFKPEEEKLFRILDVKIENKKLYGLCKFYCKSNRCVRIYCKTVSLKAYVNKNMQEILRYFRFNPWLIRDTHMVKLYKMLIIERIKTSGKNKK